MKANILNTLRSLHNDESGQDLIEYALIAALIALGSIATMRTVATSIGSAFSTVSVRLNSAVAS